MPITFPFPRVVSLTPAKPTRAPDHPPAYRLGQRVIIRATADNPSDGRRGIVQWITPNAEANGAYWVYGIHHGDSGPTFYGATYPSVERCEAWQLAPDRGVE